MRSVLVFTVFLFTITAVKGIHTRNASHSENVKAPNDAYQQFVEADKNLKAMVKSAVKFMLPYAMKASEHLNVSSKCTSHLFVLVSELQKLKLSAIEFLDATAKIPEGVLTGKNALLGDFDECLNAIVTHRNEKMAFRGQYCMVNVKPLMPPLRKGQYLLDPDKHMMEVTRNTSEFMKYILKYITGFDSVNMKVGLCVPTGCNSNDVENMVNYLIGYFRMTSKVEYCYFQEKYGVYTKRTILAVSILCLFGILLVLGTIVEYYGKERNGIFKCLGARLLMCFSVITNFPKLVSTDISETELSCIYGLRCLSLFYVILAHEYILIYYFEVYSHAMNMLETVESFFFQIIRNGILFIDVFFFIGGLLNCYIRMNVHKKYKANPNPFVILFHRIYRVYPGLVLATLVFPFIYEQAYGPRRGLIEEQLNRCDRNWWLNLIFVNNYFGLDKATCMPHTWYIAADMQLFVISLFTIPVLFKNPKGGVILHIIMIFIGMALTGTLVWYQNIEPAVLIISNFRKELFKFVTFYLTIPPHIAPYFTGVLAGFYLSVKENVKISKAFQLLAWLMAIIAYVSMLFLPIIWKSTDDYTKLQAVLYMTFSRFLYVLAIAWMVICCARGYGGIVNYILSLKIWIPIARISFMTYLLSPVLQTFFNGNLRIINDMQNMVLIWRHFGDLMASLSLSLVLVLIAESPFIALEKILLSKHLRHKNTDNPTKENNTAVFYNTYENDATVTTLKNTKIVAENDTS